MNRSDESNSLLPPLWIITLLVVGLTIWIAYELKEMMVLLVIGYSIAFAINPMVDALERGVGKLPKLGRAGAVLGIFVFAAVFLILLFITAVPTLIEEYRQLVIHLPSYLQIVQERLLAFREAVSANSPPAIAAKIAEFSISEFAPPMNGETLNRILGGLFAALLQGYSVTLTIVNLTLLPFIVFYLSRDFNEFNRRLLSLFPRSRRLVIWQAAKEVDQILSAFVKGQLLVGTILFVLYAVGLSLIGIKLWFLIAVVAGFGQLVPYLGFVLGILLSTVMALVTYGDIYHLILVWSVFGIIQLLESFVITPKIVGESVGLSPLAVIIALFAGGVLFGLLGIFLAVPVAAAAKVIVQRLYSQLLESLDSQPA